MIKLKSFIPLLITLLCTLVWALPAIAASQATMYHRAGCMCCKHYAAYLQEHGFDVHIADNTDVAAINAKLGVPRRLASCHTTRISDYTVVGHVPLKAVHRLLRQKPDIRGISLPGMRMGSPGMGGQQRRPFVIRTLDGDVYMTIKG